MVGETALVICVYAFTRAAKAAIEGGSMRREQKGSLFQKSGVWYVRYATDRVIDDKVKRQRVSRPLAEGISKKKARELARELLAGVTHSSRTFTFRESSSARALQHSAAMQLNLFDSFMRAHRHLDVRIISLTAQAAQYVCWHGEQL
jgi:hypothetical protein